jgi:hypothetical protein
VYSSTRSTDTIWFSISALWRMSHCTKPMDRTPTHASPLKAPQHHRHDGAALTSQLHKERQAEADDTRVHGASKRNTAEARHSEQH